MTPDPNVVLVTDGEQRAALAVVRSLGAAGFRVIVAAQRKTSLAGASRFAAGKIQVPSALVDPASFVTAIRSATEANNVGLLIPIADDSLLPILEAREQFRGITIPFATLDQMRRISDKGALLRIASKLGISVPEQRVVESRSTAHDVDIPSLRFPVVVKPSRSVVEIGAKRAKVGVSHAADAAELEARIASYPDGAFPLLVQQRVVGPGIGVFLLVWNGETVAVFGHRRIREHPPSGGVSVYREAILPDPELVAKSRALLDCFMWQGVAMIEYKVEASTGDPYLMEVNGRFWGSLQLAIDAGVDFPALLARVARTGEGNVGAVHAGALRPGIRSRWEWGEASHLLARVRKSREELALPADAPSLPRTLIDMFRWRRGDRLEILRLSDPAPFWRETVDWFKRR
ncbi:MAG TPA: ATP-grasp domain-containing protein [Gemmatimonadaceae bacterium]|nr:ATP-grasp domain-containing protein [Gemmatimonadaceae bacterium]